MRGLMTDAHTTRGNLSIVLAACIVAAGLVGAALIVAHRSVTTAAVVTAKPVALPPITQESARDQFRAQALASPKLHSWVDHKVVYTLQDLQVKSDDVSYSAKDDTFEIPYHLVVTPAPPAGTGGISLDGSSTLNNDGYNHYSGLVIADSGDSQPGTPFLASDNVTIK